MHELDAIEAINIEQLVTATDRILFRGSMTRGRPTRAQTRRTVDLTHDARAALAASSAAVEETVFVRQRSRVRELAPVALVSLATYLGVVMACLLP